MSYNEKDCGKNESLAAEVICPELLEKVADVIENGEKSGEFFSETAKMVIKICFLHEKQA